MRKVFRTLVTVGEARDLLKRALEKVIKIEEISVEDSIGKVLAKDVYSPINIPPFTRSTRDGYAVRYVDVSKARENAPIKLKIIGFSRVGLKTNLYVNQGEAVEIDTGAIVPAGADAVVMEEFTEKDGDYVKIYKPVGPGENIQYTGTDAFKGELLLSKGVIITPREIGVLSAAGIKKVCVYGGLRVCVISTGDEITYVGDKLDFGKIYDVNGPMITATLRNIGIYADYIGIAKDDPDEISNMINNALKNYNLIITSGSTSVGTRDQLINLIEQIKGAKILFHGIKQKPGRPTLAALIDDKVFIGLPGFPVSALMVFYNVVYPVLTDLMKLYDEKYIIRGKLGVDVWGEVGQLDLIPVVVKRRNDNYVIYPVKTDSGAIVTLSLSDGYIEIPDGQFYLEAGEEVDIQLFSKNIKIADLMVIGSHSIALDKIIAEFMILNKINIKRIWTGSSGVYEAIKTGLSDLGGTHLLDEKTGEYNVPFITRFGVSNVVLYRGFMREVGLVVAKGNPYNISSLWDIYTKNLKFINRTRGSGTRSLIDMILKREARKHGLKFDEVINKIDGYRIEAKTHDAVVTAVEVGYADVGVAVKPAVIGHNVDFISITKEYYDILVSKVSLENTITKKFLDFIFGENGKRILFNIPGIIIPHDYGKVIYEG